MRAFYKEELWEIKTNLPHCVFVLQTELDPYNIVIITRDTREEHVYAGELKIYQP